MSDGNPRRRFRPHNSHLARQRTLKTFPLLHLRRYIFSHLLRGIEDAPACPLRSRNVNYVSSRPGCPSDIASASSTVVLILILIRNALFPREIHLRGIFHKVWRSQARSKRRSGGGGADRQSRLINWHLLELLQPEKKVGGGEYANARVLG